MKVKVKMKLDKAALMQFFTDNGEKIGLAVVALAAVAIVYGAMSQKSYTRLPDQLVDVSNAAAQHINQTDHVPPAECNAPPFWILVEKSEYPIDPSSYAWDVLIDYKVGKILKLRPQPELLTAQKLCATVGRGAFAIKPPPGKRQQPQKQQQGKRYVVVTARVPLEEQTAAYREAFDSAVATNPVPDKGPEYGYFRVQRAIVPSSPGQELQWETIANSWTGIDELLDDWPRTDSEVVDGKFTGGGAGNVNGARQARGDSHSRLVYPLPPLMHGGWGPEVAHLPEIPLLSREKAGDTHQGGKEPPPPDGKKEHHSSDPWAAGAETTPRTPELVRPEDEKEKALKYLLLRFFDLDSKLQPGGKYRYRVCLVLGNPNYKVKTGFLARPESAKSRSLDSPWSEPSGEVTVPPDVNILARAVAVSRQGEPEGRVTIMKWLEDTGITAHEEFGKIVRGQNLDWLHIKFRTAPPKPDLNRPDHGHSHPRPSGPRPPTDDRDVVSVNYATGALAVDLAGGDGFGQLLVLDGAGNLVAHNSIDDDAVFQQWEDQEKASTQRGRENAEAGGIREPNNPATPSLDNIPGPKRQGGRPPRVR